MASALFRTFSPFIDLMPEVFRIHFLFFLKHKYFCKLDNPLTFSEKVQYRKLFDRNNLYPVLVDKLKVKYFVREHFPDLIVPKLLWQGSDFHKFDLSCMPNSFVFKSNHASGTNLIIRDKKNFDINIFERSFNQWIDLDISKTYVEWAYGGGEKFFFAEEYLDFDADVPVDYKFWVFDGVVKYIQVDVGRFSDHRRSFFDIDWNEQNFILTYPAIGYPMPKPSNFSEMVDVASRMGSLFSFVRIDLYSDGCNVYFGEFTFYPGSGYEVFFPASVDATIGAMWKLPR